MCLTLNQYQLNIDCNVRMLQVISMVTTEKISIEYTPRKGKENQNMALLQRIIGTKAIRIQKTSNKMAKVNAFF